MGLFPDGEGLHWQCFHHLQGILLFLFKTLGPICHFVVFYRSDVCSSWSPGPVSFPTNHVGSAPSISFLRGTTGGCSERTTCSFLVIQPQGVVARTHKP